MRISDWSSDVCSSDLLSGGIRTDLAQYRELAAFAQFASDLDDATRRQLERGKRVVELLKQPQYQPLQVWELGVTLFAVNNGYLDDLEVEQILSFEKPLTDYLKSKHDGLRSEERRVGKECVSTGSSRWKQ